jgi:hypothetical protein
MLGSCTKEDLPYEEGKLTFSMDTLSFDTLFSGIGSTTAWLRVVNNGPSDIEVSRVSLKTGGQSGFMINLDGENAKEFKDVTIPAHDSLFLFVQLTSKIQDNDKPVKIEDAVIFETAKGSQQIVLNAWSWDAVLWRGKTITKDTVLTNNHPFVIYDSLVVAENVTLTLKEGVTFHMHESSRIVVRGTIKAQGAIGAPVTVRGDRLDYILEDFPYDYNPGQWHFIQLASTSKNNEMDHMVIKGGYYGIIVDSTSTENVVLKLTNSVVHNFYYSCLWSVSSNIEVANSQITNSGSYTVCLIGGRSLFTHCTIANHQDLIYRDGPALAMVNVTLDSLKNETPWPLKAHFRNSIIHGSQTEEIGLGISKNTGILSDIKFESCALRTKTDLGGLAVNCIKSDSVRFVKLSRENEKNVFDFRVDSASVVIGKANSVYSALYPTDMNGISRFDADGPDIGAYEFKKKAK